MVINSASEAVKTEGTKKNLLIAELLRCRIAEVIVGVGLDQRTNPGQQPHQVEGVDLESDEAPSTFHMNQQ